jgi:hypothetical protein
MLLGSAKEKEQIRQQQAYNNKKWEIEKAEATAQLGIQNARLGLNLADDVGQFNLGLQGQALQTGAAQVSLEQSIGAAQAQQGMSGTRGNAGLDTNIAYQRDQFDAQVGLQNQGNSLAMQDMSRQYSYQFNDIGREMDSWQTGGYRSEMHNLDDWYTAQGFDIAMDNATPTAFDWISAGFGGAASGANFGKTLAGAKWVNPFKR